MKIAWIGTGVMGSAMIKNLQRANYEVHIYNRTIEKMKDIDTPYKYDNIEACVKDCDIIFTMVGYPKDVEEVYFNNGILKYAKEGSILIDMTTSSPELACKIANHSNTFKVLDAPVSGGDKGAKEGTLSIMVGGDETIFKQILPVLKVLGSNINLIGTNGMGQHCKMCNQIAVAGATAAMAEALVYAKYNNLDPQLVLQAIGSGAAQSWQLSNMAPRVLNNDLDPGFYIKHFTKDMRIAKEAIEKCDFDLQMLNTVYDMYSELEENGYQDYGTQALIKYYEK